MKQVKYFMQMYSRVLKKAFNNNQNLWAKEFVESLNKKAYILSQDESDILETFNTYEEALFVVQNLYCNDELLWADLSCQVLNMFSIFCYQFEDEENAANLLKGAIIISKKMKEHKNKNWIYRYCELLNNYVLMNENLINLSQIINELENLLEIYKNNIDDLVYIQLLKTYASLIEKTDSDKAVLLYKNILELREKLYNPSNLSGAYEYVLALIDLVTFSNQENKFDLLEKAEFILFELYKGNSKKWFYESLKIKNIIIRSLFESQNISRAIDKTKEVLLMIRQNDLYSLKKSIRKKLFIYQF